MAEFPQTDLYDKVLYLGLPQESTVVVGSRTIEAVVGPDIRRGADTDLVVPDEAYRHLRERPEMEEIIEPSDGYRHLVGDGYDIATTRGGKTGEELIAGGYSHRGVNLAGLPDIYAFKQRGDRPPEKGDPHKDQRDLTIIQDRLYSAEILPDAILEEQLRFIRKYMPERLHGRPELKVAANGLYIVSTLFGIESGTVRTYSGTVEKEAVPATYHAWKHSAFGYRAGQRNHDLRDARREAELRVAGQTMSAKEREERDDERIQSGTAFANHDVILGHGREAANPKAHDEKQAAEHVVRQLRGVGVTDEHKLQGTYQGVIVTAFTEATKGQNIDETRGHITVQHTGAGCDMYACRTSEGPINAGRLAIEDLFRVGAGYDAPLARLLKELNAKLPAGAPPIRVETPEAGALLIDTHPDYPVTRTMPDGTIIKTTLRNALADHYDGSSKFQRNYKFPKRWLVGDPAMQGQNADELAATAEGVRNGTINAVESLQRLEQYKQRYMDLTTAAIPAPQETSVLPVESSTSSSDPITTFLNKIKRAFGG